MKELVKDLQELTLKNDQQNLQTGVTYHLDTNLHTYPIEHNSKNENFETHKRLEIILKRFNEKNCLKDCEVISNFEEVSWDLVKATHGEKYVKYLLNLDENSQSVLWNDIDGETYFISNSLRAAKLAAEATRIAVDNVLKGNWKNAFALVRPPGHHAGVNGIIAGYCIINNIALAAKYLKINGVKKIAILDWDIHHGDSTQEIFYNDDRVLYISIHKYCDGEYYPYSQNADSDKLGAEKGEGFNLNFPLNPEKNEFIGDQEYVYIFQRAILPVLKEFQPEFVLISSGFDCLNGDPLGKQYVTHDTLAFMLKKIILEITQKIVVVLEGGYNLEAIAKASEILLQVLKGDFFCLDTNTLQQRDVKKAQYVQCLPYFLQQCEKNFENWSKFWPILKNEENLSYQNLIVKKVEEEMKLPFAALEDYKLIKDRLIKQIDKIEKNFYERVLPFNDDFQNFIPRYFGVISTDKGDFLKLENFVDNPDDTNILIIIIDSKKKGKTYGVQYWLDKKFKFTLCKMMQKGRIIERRKNSYLKFLDDQDKQMLKRFFLNYKQQFSKKAVDELILNLEKKKQLKQIGVFGFSRFLIDS